METSPIFDHWSFQLSRPPLPDLQDGQSAHPVDRHPERLRGEAQMPRLGLTRKPLPAASPRSFWGSLFGWIGGLFADPELMPTE